MALFHTTATIPGDTLEECFVKFIKLVQSLEVAPHREVLTSALRSARSWARANKGRKGTYNLPIRAQQALLIRAALGAAMMTASKGGGSSMCLHTAPSGGLQHVYYYSDHVRILMSTTLLAGRHLDIVINAQDQPRALNFIVDLYKGRAVPTTKPLEPLNAISLDSIGLGVLL